MKTDNKIIAYKDLEKARNSIAARNQSIVLTTGCYDLLHLGHILHFSYCKSKGDVLFVSLGNDKTVAALKGPGRPIMNERFRARMVASVEYVDYVIVSEESGKMDHNRLVQILKPDFYVVPSGDSAYLEKKNLIEGAGGRIIGCKRLPPGHVKGGISTTKLRQLLLSL